MFFKSFSAGRQVRSVRQKSRRSVLAKPRCLLVEPLEARSLLAADFGAPEMLEAGYYPASTAVGDLNGDGRADIVSQDVGNRAFRSFLSASNGTFTQASTVLASNQEIGIPSLHDFNRDGRLDIAEERSAKIFLN